MTHPFPTVDWLPKEEQQIMRALEQSPSLGESTLIDNGMFWSEGAFESARDSRRMAMDLNTIYKQELDEWERDVRPSFKLINYEGQETIDFLLGHQWTPEDEAAHFDRGAKPYVFNDFRQFVNAVMAEGLSRKATLRAVPRNAHSEQKTEFCNKLLQHVWLDNDLDRVNFLVRRDALLYGVGFWGIAQDPTDPFGRISIRYVRPQECMWDLDTATVSCTADTRRFERMRYATRGELIAEFPEWKKELAEGGGALMETSGWEDEYTMARPKVNSRIGYREFTQELSIRNSRIFGDLLFVREYYRRRYEPRWIVVDPYTDRQFSFTTPQSAGEKTRELQAAYMEVGVPGDLGGQIFAPRPIQKTMVDQLVFIGSQLVKFTPTEDDHIPYVDYAPELYNGEVTPYFSHLKGPQRFKNRIASYAEELIAQTKGGTIVNMAHKPQNFTEQQFMDFLNGAGWKLPVNDPRPDFDPRRVLYNTAEPQNGQAIGQLMQFVTGQIDRGGGGPNNLGMAAFAGQSGDMAEQMQLAGSKLTMGIFEKERYCLKMLGEKILYFSQFLHPAIQMRTYDEGYTPQFFSMLSDGIQSMRELRFSVEVTQVSGSMSERSAQFKRLVDLIGYLPQHVHHFAELLLEKGDIDFSHKQRILEGIKAEVEGQAREREVAARTEAIMQDRKTGIQEASVLIKARQQAFIEKAVPNMSLSGDITKIPPMLLSTLINYMTSSGGKDIADPSYLMVDRALQAAQDESRLVERQTNYNENLLPEERQAIAPPKKAVATPKDVSNRAVREVMQDD